MRIAVHVDCGVCRAYRVAAGWNAGFDNGADIVAFAVVVPGHNLDELGQDLEDLYASVSSSFASSQQF